MQKILMPSSEGLMVRDPVSRTPLAAKGELKPWVGSEGRYWRRRVNDGSVIVVEQNKQKTVKK